MIDDKEYINKVISSIKYYKKELTLINRIENEQLKLVRLNYLREYNNNKLDYFAKLNLILEEINNLDEAYWRNILLSNDIFKVNLKDKLVLAYLNRINLSCCINDNTIEVSFVFTFLRNDYFSNEKLFIRFNLFYDLDLKCYLILNNFDNKKDSINWTTKDSSCQYKLLNKNKSVSEYVKVSSFFDIFNNQSNEETYYKLIELINK